MQKYKIDSIIKKNKEHYFVKSPSGEVMNGAYFEDKKKAENYRDILNSFYGDKNGIHKNRT